MKIIQQQALLALLPLAAAHSWIERAYRIASNGTMVEPAGYARGWVFRDSGHFADDVPMNRLPANTGQAYLGDELLNKFPFVPNPDFHILEAAPGDHIALIHLENGHTTVLSQPNKPKNRGTIFFYGTSQPKENERLFDVHLLWNRDGTGGDKRGRLLGTRNFDDGQCYQPSRTEIALARADKLKPLGADPGIELSCQSDIQLPDDLEPGSIYTIYWYWDWPDLEPQHIDLEKTINGQFPWAGTFMRGEKDPNGFSMSAIQKNESYTSVIDIKIAKPDAEGFQNKAFTGASFVQDQDIYMKAIKEQLNGNFQVDVDVPGDAPGHVDSPEEPKPEQPSTTITKSAPAGGATVTVTRVVTVPPETVIKTVTITTGGEASPTTTSVELPGSVFITSNLPGVPQPSSSTSPSMVSPPPPEETEPAGGRPTVTPFMRARDNWGLGRW